jgi:hypothetical protein
VLTLVAMDAKGTVIAVALKNVKMDVEAALKIVLQDVPMVV